MTRRQTSRSGRTLYTPLLLLPHTPWLPAPTRPCFRPRRCIPRPIGLESRGCSMLTRRELPQLVSLISKSGDGFPAEHLISFMLEGRCQKTARYKNDWRLNAFKVEICFAPMAFVRTFDMS